MSFYNDLIENYMEDKVKLPKRLKKFFKDEYEDYEGKYVSGLPSYSADSRLPLSFSEDSLENLFEEHIDNDLANEDDRFKYLPLASLDDAQYMAVCITDKDCPVYMWEHEDGEFHEHSSSLDEFLEDLHDEGNNENYGAEECNDESEDWTSRKFKISDGTKIGSGKSAGIGKPGEVPDNYSPERDKPLSAYRNVAGCPKDEKWGYILFIDTWNWDNYDYTKWPCADMSFPDLDEDKSYDLWPYKPQSGMEGHTMHWMDLHNYKSGIERKVVIDGNWEEFKLPEKYKGKHAEKLVPEFEQLLKENDPAKIQAAGFKNLDHVKYTIAINKKAIAKAYAENDKVISESLAKSKKQMDSNIESAKKGGLLDPVKGVSMEDWAAANAKIMGGMALNDVLKILGIEKPVWDEVSAEWNARMSRDSTFAISTVYGNAFVDSNIGKFASAGNGNASKSSDAIEKVKNDFELYVKIMCHQSVGSAHGLDATAVLKQYGLNAADWGTLGAYWSPKMVTTEYAMKMTTLMEKYNAEFAQGAPAKAGDDIEF